MIALEDWWSGGHQVEVSGRRFFTRTEGQGPTIVFLHGFPTSSHDWSGVIEDLSTDHHCVTFDYLGFGASDKPTDADYTSRAQTERTMEILGKLGVTSATVVGHDLGGIVLQQLVHAAFHGRTTLEIKQAVFANSSVYPALYRPTPGQVALVDPILGKQIASQITAESFGGSIAAMFPAHPRSPEQIDALWRSVSRDNGQLLWPEQLVYMAERAEHGSAWIAAMQKSQIPLGFIYGLADPISGAHILDHAQVDLPAARCIGLSGLGHYPQVEAPVQFAKALRDLLSD